jgi:serine/threonine-protein kinase
VVANVENTEGEIPPGTVVLGRYQVLGKLAQGGMAEVYLARQVGPGGYQKLVVTKRVRPHLSKDEDFVGMFVNEARLAAMINHPNVVQIFDLGEEPSVDPSNAGGSDWFLAMEYLDGRDMLQVGRACRSHNKAVPFDVTARIIADACAGLEHAHNLKGADGRPLDLVHRDMSPENIIITFEGQVKVVDFGIAKAADNSIRTQAGQIKGKLGYVAPEAILGKPVDARADIFAIGATLYLFLSGRPAFSGTSPMEIFERSLKPPLSPQEVNPRVPPALDEICMKALAQDRNERYRTAGEVRAALDAYLSSTGRPLAAPQLSQFMRILFPPDKDPVRQRIDKLLVDAQSFGPPKKAAAPRTISVPQVPAVALAPEPPEPTLVAPERPTRPVPTELPRAVDIGPAVAPVPPATGSATQKAMLRVGPAHLRSVGIAEEIPDVSNPRANLPAPPIDDDGRTHITEQAPRAPNRSVPTLENVEQVNTMDVVGLPPDTRAALDEPTVGGIDIDVDVDMEGATAEGRTLSQALADDAELRGSLEDALNSELGDDDAPTSHQVLDSLPPPPSSDPSNPVTVQSPYHRGQTNARLPETGDAQGTELPPPFEASMPRAVAPPPSYNDGPPVGEPSSDAPLFQPPAQDFAREEFVLDARPAPAGPVPLGMRIGMAAFGAVTGVGLLWIGLAVTGHLHWITGR